MGDHVKPKKSFAERIAEYPFRIRAAVGVLVAAAGSLGVIYGIEIDSALVENVTIGILEILVLVGVIKLGERQATPLANPKDNDGNPLVPILPEAHEEASDEIE